MGNSGDLSPSYHTFSMGQNSISLEHVIALSLSPGEEGLCPGYLCYKKLNNAKEKRNLGTLKDGVGGKHFLSNFQPDAPVSLQTNEVPSVPLSRH